MEEERNEPFTITKEEFLKAIEWVPDDGKLYFGNGDLSFQRIKSRGNELYQVEFDQLYNITE